MTLREARRSRGLTQQALAKRSGIEQQAISNIETGRVRMPQWDTVAKLSKALGLKPDTLFPISIAR